MKAYDENTKYILFINKSITILGCSTVNSLTIGFLGYISQQIECLKHLTRHLFIGVKGTPKEKTHSISNALSDLHIKDLRVFRQKDSSALICEYKFSPTCAFEEGCFCIPSKIRKIQNLPHGKRIKFLFQNIR